MPKRNIIDALSQLIFCKNTNPPPSRIDKGLPPYLKAPPRSTHRSKQLRSVDELMEGVDGWRTELVEDRYQIQKCIGFSSAVDLRLNNSCSNCPNYALEIKDVALGINYNRGCRLVDWMPFPVRTYKNVCMLHSLLPFRMSFENTYLDYWNLDKKQVLAVEEVIKILYSNKYFIEKVKQKEGNGKNE
ncbi:MAG: hypothetical protein GY841_15515 [FCB group bacterium]|nr:hypothetical protein [FCB group bacterium]